MNKRFNDPDKRKVITFAFAISVLILIIAVWAMPSKADAVLELDNGYNIEVPSTWEVAIHPKGYNLRPYDSVKNPKGKLPGWGGWPKYTEYLEKNNCHPGELVISPSACPPQPRSVKPYTQCYFEPIPEPEIKEERCLKISPARDCEE